MPALGRAGEEMKHLIEATLFATVVTLIILTLAMGQANADPRIEVNADNTFCHILHGNAGNADDETFDGGCAPFVAANGVGGADGWGSSERFGVPAEAVAHVFRYGREVTVGHCPPGQKKKKKCQTEWVVDVTQDDYPGLQCTLVETNGTQYQSATWHNRITWENGVLVNTLLCSNGQ